MLAGLFVECFRRCPWYLERVVVYAWCKSSPHSGWVVEAELLFPLWEWSNLRGKLLLAPGVRLTSRSVVSVAWWPPLVFGVELACLLEDPTVSVGMISWPVRVAVNLTRSVQYPIEGGWSVLSCLQRLLPVTGLWIVKFCVDRYVA
jgi:hypothetical protein